MMSWVQSHRKNVILSVLLSQVYMAAENINSDLPLAKACKADVEKLCTTLAAGTTVLACLREKKEELSSECKTEVFDRQAGAADDWRTDTELFKACQVRRIASFYKQSTSHVFYRRQLYDVMRWLSVERLPQLWIAAHTVWLQSEQAHAAVAG